MENSGLRRVFLNHAAISCPRVLFLSRKKGKRRRKKSDQQIQDFVYFIFIRSFHILSGKGISPHIIIFIDFYIQAIQSSIVSFSGVIEP